MKTVRVEYTLRIMGKEWVQRIQKLLKSRANY